MKTLLKVLLIWFCFANIFCGNAQVPDILLAALQLLKLNRNKYNVRWHIRSPTVVL